MVFLLPLLVGCAALIRSNTFEVELKAVPTNSTFSWEGQDEDDIEQVDASGDTTLHVLRGAPRGLRKRYTEVISGTGERVRIRQDSDRYVKFESPGYCTEYLYFPGKVGFGTTVLMLLDTLTVIPVVVDLTAFPRRLTSHSVDGVVFEPRLCGPDEVTPATTRVEFVPWKTGHDFNVSGFLADSAFFSGSTTVYRMELQNLGTSPITLDFENGGTPLVLFNTRGWGSTGTPHRYLEIPMDGSPKRVMIRPTRPRSVVAGSIGTIVGPVIMVASFFGPGASLPIFLLGSAILGGGIPLLVTGSVDLVGVQHLDTELDDGPLPPPPLENMDEDE